MDFSGRRRILHIGLYAAAYLAAALIGLRFASFGGVASAFWPAAGIALAGLVVIGPKWWPVFTAASFAAFILAGTEHAAGWDALLAIGNGAAAAIAAYGLRRIRFRADFSRFLDAVFFLTAAAAAAALAAAVGTLVLSLAAEISWHTLFGSSLSWFLGDFGGILVVAPLILSWRERPAMRGLDWAHLTAALASTALLAWLAFFQSGIWRAWHVFPALVWAALGFKARGASLAMSIVAIVGVAGLVQGTGSFDDLREHGPPIVFLQQFVSIAAITMLILSAVADERRGVRQLADARRRLSVIVESAMDGIITVDKERRIVVFNPAAEQIFGCSAKEVIGQPIDRFVPERSRASHAESMRRFSRTGSTARQMGELGTLSGVRANGEEFPLEASISHVNVGDESLSTVILRDVSRRVAAEQARDLLAREVDHRAKNALAVVQAVVALTKAPTTEQYIEAVRGRIAALARAHSLLAQAKWEGADLAQLVQDELRPYGKAHEWTASGPLTFLNANTVQPFGLVIHELATNACKYGALCAGTGAVHIRWEVDVRKNLQVTWIEKGGPLVTAPGSVGFGSTLLSEVVSKQLSGAIRFDWAKAGLRVDISLPPSAYRLGAAPGAELAASSGRAQIAEVPMNATMRALVVEDEALVGLELADSLSRAGWKVVGPASTIETAMELASQDIDVAVLDVNIRGSLIYPLADLLSARGVPIVFCTGYQEFSADRYADARVVRKPVLMDELVAAVKGAARIAA